MTKKFNGNNEILGNKIIISFPDDYSYQNWQDPLSRLFHKVISFNPRKERILHGQEEMNSRFLRLVEKEKPDYILFNLISDEFSLRVFEQIREISNKTKILNFAGDDDYQFESFTRYLSIFLDAQIIYQRDFLKNYQDGGFKNTFVSIGTNMEHYKPLNLPKRYEVTFVGVPRNDRVDFIRYLVKNKVNIKIWGAGWEKYPDLKSIWGGYLKPEDFVKVINESKINLSFSKGGVGNKTYHFTGRVFEIAACKSFQLVEFYEGYLGMYKNNEEISMFRDEKELVKKVKYYLGNEKEREKMAERAYRKTVKNYDRKKELLKIFKVLSRVKAKQQQDYKNLGYKIVLIKEDDFNEGAEYLKEKTKDSDFIQFNLGNAKFSKYKSFLQIHSLSTSKKDISLCDYYINESLLGNYLLFKAKNSFYNLDKGDFDELTSLSQIMVTKDYFLDNIQNFINAFEEGVMEFVSQKNTIFLSFPLVSINEKKRISRKLISKSFEPKFIHSLSANLNNSKPHFVLYLGYLIAYALLHRNWFILHSLLEYSKMASSNLVQSSLIKEKFNKLKFLFS
ncbi:MAG: glycosyltransferase [Nanoarchaeota archaeon]